MKKQVKKNLAIMILVPVIFFVCLYLYLNKQSSNKSINSQIQNNSNQVSESISNDGVYENYTYGFRFEYQKDIFQSSIPWNDDSGKIFFVDTNALYPQLKVYLAKNNGQFDEFENCKKDFETSVNYDSVNSNVRITQLYKLDKPNSCVFLGEPGINTSEPYWFYLAYVKNDKLLIVLEWSAKSKEKLLTYRKSVDKLIRSFKFFAIVK